LGFWSFPQLGGLDIFLRGIRRVAWLNRVAEVGDLRLSKKGRGYKAWACPRSNSNGEQEQRQEQEQKRYSSRFGFAFTPAFGRAVAPSARRLLVELKLHPSGY
jgi:hypothetical protein